MKTKTTHTPGESWRIGDAGHTVFGPKTDTLSPKIVASNLSRAEARLIVAAHDLFEAAKIGLAALMVGQEQGRTPVFSNAYDQDAYEKLKSAIGNDQGK